MNIIERFEMIYVHDSGIRNINLDVQKSICRIHLDCAGVLNNPPRPFDYEVYYEPALIEFTDVKIVGLPEGYCLNDVIAEHSVQASEFPGYYRFKIATTGGWDNDTFWRVIEITAKDFSLTGTPTKFPSAN